MVLLSNLVVASLGSSFASGPGITPYVGPPDAYRSSRNYAHLFTQKLENAQLTDLAVSGATLLNILNTTQTSNQTTFEPQINGLPTDADLILVLGGGNDVGYFTSLYTDGNTTVDKAFLTNRWGLVLDALHAKAPQAEVVVITYLTMVGADAIPKGQPGENVPYTAERLAYHKNTAEQLRKATVDSVKGRHSWAQVLDVVPPSWTHGVGSKEPWAAGQNATVPWHPNADGHVAVAELLSKRLGKKGGKQHGRRAKL